MNKKLLVLLVSAAFLPLIVSADAPPPPPFDVNFTYEGQKIAETFYAVALQCRQEKIPDLVVIPQLDISQPDTAKDCSWMPRTSTFSGTCSDSVCRFDWVNGQFKLAAYIPSLSKVFVSDVINREYLGHYGRDTQTVYDVNLLKDSGVAVSNVIPPQNASGESVFGVILGLFLMGFAVTAVSESAVVLVFVLLKKAPKKIFLAVLVGNVVTVPLVWGIGLSYYSLLYVLEAIAMAFEAWIIKLFVKERLSWKMCFLISVLMNIASFTIGAMLFRFYG